MTFEITLQHRSRMKREENNNNKKRKNKQKEGVTKMANAV